jgi:hypothetical protein
MHTTVRRINRKLLSAPKRVKVILLNRARYPLLRYLLPARVSVNIDMGTTQLDVADIDTVMTQPFRVLSLVFRVRSLIFQVLSLVYKSYRSLHQCRKHVVSFTSLCSRDFVSHCNEDGCIRGSIFLS